ncbi:MAG: glutamine--tRNA ligase, partial [Rhodospirillales bacterium]|nr:glutamine--tRNA ligase [Rhodospirillales bacterium]
GHVSGWDDPRLPTISGFRRRGVPAAAIRDFADRIGVAKSNSVIEVGLLEFCMRELLNKSAVRRLAVLKPLKVVIENYPEGETEDLTAVNNPQDETAGTRTLPFSRELYIERDDFMEDPPKKFYRLGPGREVRLRFAYFITCTDVIKDASGEVVELRCTYDPETKGGSAPDGRKVKATMHWVSAAHAVPAEVRLYDHLFRVEEPGSDGDYLDDLNPESLEVLTDCQLEPSLVEAPLGETLQFERHGYFCPDKDSKPNALVFNRTVGLRDQWAKIQKDAGKKN